MVKAKVTEQVPGLQQAPEGGKFFVRKAKEPEVPVEGEETAVSTHTHDLVLVITGEDEYTTPLYAFDDGNLNNASYQLLAQRRGELRAKLFNENDEVELTQ